MLQLSEQLLAWASTQARYVVRHHHTDYVYWHCNLFFEYFNILLYMFWSFSTTIHLLFRIIPASFKFKIYIFHNLLHILHGKYFPEPNAIYEYFYQPIVAWATIILFNLVISTWSQNRKRLFWTAETFDRQFGWLFVNNFSSRPI